MTLYRERRVENSSTKDMDHGKLGVVQTHTLTHTQTHTHRHTHKHTDTHTELEIWVAENIWSIKEAGEL